MSNLRRWADEAQFRAEPVERDAAGNVEPKVYLLWMTPQPLKALAVVNSIYAGKVIRSLTEVTEEEAKYQWEQAQKNPLKAPYETIRFHFLIEGVDRTFTHQLVRQRTAAYAQESLRFAVKEDFPTSLPASLAGLKPDDPRRVVWDKALEKVQEAYDGLVNNGVPAEDARGLLPHATATRIHYMTDLRGLTYHAGRRLCTQAQFHWRIVFAKMLAAIRNYAYQLACEDFATSTGQHPDDIPLTEGDPELQEMMDGFGDWQFKAISSSMDFRPVCFQENRCPFQDDLARDCSIRERVERLSKLGVPSTEWEESYVPEYGVDLQIRPEEWLMDPTAGRSSRK